MHFQCLDVALELVRSLRAPIERIQSHDRSLADQLRRAASSIPLNLAEGRRRNGKDRRHLWRVAAGSADETRSCLLVADAWGYVDAKDLSESLELADRVVAMCWRLTR